MVYRSKSRSSLTIIWKNRGGSTREHLFPGLNEQWKKKKGEAGNFSGSKCQLTGIKATRKSP